MGPLVCMLVILLMLKRDEKPADVVNGEEAKEPL